MIAARYAPLVLTPPLNALRGGDYQKYMPRFDGQGDATAEEHWNKFCSFAHNQNYEHTYVWMRLFVQSLDGEVRKWFRELPPGSIDGIDALEETFMKQWGDTKDYLYYQTKFHALKRKKGEDVGDFSKRFNKMYSKIPAEIKPMETAARLAYANAFNPEFSLLLRERKSDSLLNMQSAALEVESNILASNRLKEETEHQIVDRKGKKAVSTSRQVGRSSDGKMDEMGKLLKHLSDKIDRLEVGNRNRNQNRSVPENDRSPNQFRRPFAPRFFPRER